MTRSADPASRPVRAVFAVTALVTAVGASVQLWWYGLTTIAASQLAFVALLALYATGIVPVAGRSGQAGVAAAATATAVLAFLTAALFVPTLARLPIFAGAEVAVASAGASAVLGPAVAAEGDRFVVLDVELRPRLGADLGRLSIYDLALETPQGRFDYASLSGGRAPGWPTSSLPDGCFQHDLPRRAAVRCRLAFELPAAVTSGRLVWDDGPYHLRSDELRFEAD